MDVKVIYTYYNIKRIVEACGLTFLGLDLFNEQGGVGFKVAVSTDTHCKILTILPNNIPSNNIELSLVVACLNALDITPFISRKYGIYYEEV